MNCLELRVSWEELQEDLGRQLSQSTAYYTIAEVKKAASKSF